MRGKQNLPPEIDARFRITPADAGKTHVDGGENLYRYKSPPRMRGKPKVCIYMRRRERITPADAGKTEQIPDKRLLRKDHPRGCGENSSIKSSLRFSLGSPPRMRGKLDRNEYKKIYNRITPADAGKTLLPTGRRNAGQDHPRGCGENGNRHKVWDAYEGSPPRMRGKLIGYIIPLSVKKSNI